MTRQVAAFVAAAALGAFPALAENRAVIPVAGATPGAFGSQFKTELQLHNRSSQPMRGKLVFHPVGIAATPADPFVEYELEPHETLAIDDFVATFGRSGLGSVDIIAEGKGIPVAVIRAFDDKGDGGTTGASIPLIHPESVPTAGQHVVLVAPSDRQRFRFNIGVRSLSSGATLRFDVYSPAGVLLHSTASRSYLPDYFLQQSAETLLETTLIGNESIDVVVIGGSAIVYGTTTDNSTNDPSIQIATKAEP